MSECCIPACTNNVYRITNLVDKRSVCKFFSEQDENVNIQPESSMHEKGVGLCKKHYGTWYRHIHPFHTKCKICEKNITDMSKSRVCPQPQVIQKYLRDNTDFVGEICIDDKVCYTCYKSHLIIIKHINSTVSSTDADLHLLIAQIQQNIPRVSDVHTLDQAIQFTSNVLAVEVGEAILKQTALLLPSTYEKFCDKLTAMTTAHGIQINEEIPKLVTANWLCSQLSSMLEHHLAFRCSVKRYGTVLYRYGGDLLHALNVSLGSARVQTSTCNTGTDNDFQHDLTNYFKCQVTRVH